MAYGLSPAELAKLGVNLQNPDEINQAQATFDQYTQEQNIDATQLTGSNIQDFAAATGSTFDYTPFNFIQAAEQSQATTAPVTATPTTPAAQTVPDYGYEKNMYTPIATNVNTNANRMGYMDFYKQFSGQIGSVADPYAQGLLAAGMESGATAGQLPDIDFDKLKSEQLEQLNTAVWTPAAIEKQRAMDEIAKNQQKYGKLSSSKTMQEMRDYSEYYDLQKTSQMAQGALSVYDQVNNMMMQERQLKSQAIQNERNRVMESSLKRTELGVGQQLAVMQLAQQAAEFDISTTNDMTKFIKGLQLEEAQTINPDTGKPYSYDIAMNTLDEQIRQFDLTQQSDWDKMVYTTETMVSEGALDRASAEKIVEKQLTSAENIVDINNTAEWDRLQSNLSTMVSEGQLSRDAAAKISTYQLANAFSIAKMDNQTTLDALEAQIKWNEKELGMSLEQQWDIFSAEIKENMRQYNMNNYQERTQFTASLEWAKKQFGLTQEQEMNIYNGQMKESMREFNMNWYQDQKQFSASLQWAREEYNMTKEQQWEMFQGDLKEKMREFNMNNYESRTQFTRSLTWAKEQFGLSQAQEKEIVESQIKEQMREYNMDWYQNNRQFSSNLQWAKESFGLEDTRIRALQTQYIREQSREFNITNTQDMIKWHKTFNQTVEQFGTDNQYRYTALAASLGMQKEQMDNAQDLAFIDSALSVLNNPAIVSTLMAIEDESGDTTIPDSFMTAVFTSLAENSNLAGIDWTALLDKVKNGGVQKPQMDTVAWNEWETWDNGKRVEFIMSHGGSERYINYIT